MISPSDMVLFAKVVDEGSFTRAAKLLGVTKQTVSERVSKLEDRLGVRLLERTTRQLRVTATGAAYYDRCAAISAQIAEANDEAMQQQAEPVGLLRVCSPTLYGRRFLAPVVSRFLATHPNARVELVLADRRVHLIEEGFDLAIQLGKLDDSTLVARKLGEGAMHFVASPKYLAKHGMPKPGAPASMRCIGLSPFQTWPLAGVMTRVDPVLIVNDLEVACAAAIDGVGVACVPEVICQDALRDGRLKRLFGPRPAMVRPIHAVYPSRKLLPTRVRLFLDALSTVAEPAPRPLTRGGKRGAGEGVAGSRVPSR